MAKSNNQKAKILFLEQLLRETGENRTVSMQEILDMLGEKGITAERKSVYDDMEALRLFGMDVRFRRGRPGGYYLAGKIVPENVKKPTETLSMPTESDTESLMPETQEPAEGLFLRGNTASDKKMRLLCEAETEKDVRRFFGDSAEYVSREDGMLLIIAPLLSDPQFYGWMTAMAGKVKIVKPKKAGQAYREFLKAIAREYKSLP